MTVGKDVSPLFPYVVNCMQVGPLPSVWAATLVCVAETCPPWAVSLSPVQKSCLLGLDCPVVYSRGCRL